jgi:hypothetical protein
VRERERESGGTARHCSVIRVDADSLRPAPGLPARRAETSVRVTNLPGHCGRSGKSVTRTDVTAVRVCQVVLHGMSMTDTDRAVRVCPRHIPGLSESQSESVRVTVRVTVRLAEPLESDYFDSKGRLTRKQRPAGGGGGPQADTGACRAGAPRHSDSEHTMAACLPAAEYGLSRLGGCWIAGFGGMCAACSGPRRLHGPAHGTACARVCACEYGVGRLGGSRSCRLRGPGRDPPKRLTRTLSRRGPECTLLPPPFSLSRRGPECTLLPPPFSLSRRGPECTLLPPPFSLSRRGPELWPACACVRRLHGPVRGTACACVCACVRARTRTACVRVRACVTHARRVCSQASVCVRAHAHTQSTHAACVRPSARTRTPLVCTRRIYWGFAAVWLAPTSTRPRGPNATVFKFDHSFDRLVGTLPTHTRQRTPLVGLRSGRVANLAVTARHGSPETTRILETTRAMASEGPSEGGRDGRVRV